MTLEILGSKDLICRTLQGLLDGKQHWMEGDLGWKTTLAGRQPWMEYNLDGKQPLLEDNL